MVVGTMVVADHVTVVIIDEYISFSISPILTVTVFHYLSVLAAANTAHSDMSPPRVPTSAQSVASLRTASSSEKYSTLGHLHASNSLSSSHDTILDMAEQIDPIIRKDLVFSLDGESRCVYVWCVLIMFGYIFCCLFVCMLSLGCWLLQPLNCIHAFIDMQMTWTHERMNIVSPHRHRDLCRQFPLQL